MTEREEPVIITIGDLKEVISTLPDDTPLLVHLGWDWKVAECDLDETGFILFPDVPDQMILIDKKFIDFGESK